MTHAIDEITAHTGEPGAVDVASARASSSNDVADVFRRVLDILVASVCLMVSSPLLLLIAIAIRIDSPGWPVFRQPRVGKNGAEFTFYKFRGMYVDARQRWPAMYDYRYSAEELFDLHFHAECDPRVTRVGRILRRSSADELLNFWNVLKGDMALVGPRPEIPDLIEHYGSAAEVLLSVKPGVTSLAKVSGRDELTFGESIIKELEYVRRRSLFFDLKIMAATVATVVLQRGVLPG